MIAIGTAQIAISSRARFVRCGIPETTSYHLGVQPPFALDNGGLQECRFDAADILSREAAITGIEMNALLTHVPSEELIALDRETGKRSPAVFPRTISEGENSAQQATTLAGLCLNLPPLELLGRTFSDGPVPSYAPAIQRGVAPRFRVGVPRADLAPEDWLQLLQLLQTPLRIDDLLSKELPHALHPYQVQGVKHLITEERFLLADEMGTGKTVQVCAALTLLWRLGRIRQVLVVCPKTALSVWSSHVGEWVPGAIYALYPERPNARLSHAGNLAVQIMSYSRLSSASDTTLSRFPRDWDVIVFDEIHVLRNMLTQRYRAAAQLVGKARYRWGLSGTPIQNRIEDLQAVCALIRPEVRIDPELSPEQVRARIRPIIRRVRRKDVLPQLPAKRRKVIWLEMAPLQRQEYNRALRQAQITFQTRRSGVVGWQLFLQLQQICNFPSSAPSKKCQELKDLVRRIVERNDKVVIFTRFLHYGLYKLEAELRPFGLVSIHGQINDVGRKEAIARFQHDATCRVCVSTIQTGGMGITLTAANHVVHFDHWWNPAVAWQAEDRVYRIGQTKTVWVYDLWMKDSVEERIQSILTEKGLLHEEIIENLSESEFKRQFSLKDLERILGLPGTSHAE